MKPRADSTSRQTRSLLHRLVDGSRDPHRTLALLRTTLNDFGIEDGDSEDEPNGHRRRHPGRVAHRLTLSGRHAHEESLADALDAVHALYTTHGGEDARVRDLFDGFHTPEKFATLSANIKALSKAAPISRGGSQLPEDAPGVIRILYRSLTKHRETSVTQSDKGRILLMWTAMGVVRSWRVVTQAFVDPNHADYGWLHERVDGLRAARGQHGGSERALLKAWFAPYLGFDLRRSENNNNSPDLFKNWNSILKIGKAIYELCNVFGTGILALIPYTR